MATETNENITVAELAYAAGVIDSDGCITLTRYPTTAGNWTYPITVCVSMIILKKDRAGLAIKLALMSRKRGGGQGWRFGQAVLTEKELSDRLDVATQLRQANSSANSRVKFTSKWGEEDR